MALLLILVVTGCGTKKEEDVVCTKIDADANVGYELTTEITGVVKKNKISTERLKMTMKFGDEKAAQSAYDAVKEEMKNEEADIELVGNVITVIQKADYEEDVTTSEFKDIYTMDGYICE